MQSQDANRFICVLTIFANRIMILLWFFQFKKFHTIRSRSLTLCVCVCACTPPTSTTNPTMTNNSEGVKSFLFVYKFYRLDLFTICFEYKLTSLIRFICNSKLGKFQFYPQQMHVRRCIGPFSQIISRIFLFHEQVSPKHMFTHEYGWFGWRWKKDNNIKTCTHASSQPNWRMLGVYFFALFLSFPFQISVIES